MKRSIDTGNNKQIKQRDFLFTLPIIVLPFLTFLLWSVGLVGGSKAKASTAQNGLNMQLPNAKLKEDKDWNKLSFYEQADKDSALHTSAGKNDLFFQPEKDSLQLSAGNKSAGSYNPLPPNYEDTNEYKVTQKLAQLNTALQNNNQDERPRANQKTLSQTAPQVPPADVDRLEQMLQAVNQPDSSSNPETEHLNGMMDKILDIQHPERISEKLQQASEKNKKFVYPVTTNHSDDYVSLLEPAYGNKKGKSNRGIEVGKRNAFYSLSTDTIKQQKQNIIEAEVEETQTVVSGSVIKLSLQNDVYINGIDVPGGTFLWGTAALGNERLNISITSIHYANNLLPVAFSVYDLDGLQGIYMPGSVNRDVAKQSGSEALNNLGVSSFDPSLGAQAANAGITAAKALINKKVKQVKVTIKEGYKVLLKDENQK